MPMHRHRSSVQPCFHLFPVLSPPPSCSVSTSFILRYRPLPACVIASFLPALRCKQFLFLSYKVCLCAQNIIVRRPSAALPTAVTPCVRRPSSMLPTAAAHSALHAQTPTTGTQTPQQYTANHRPLCAAPPSIFFTIIHSYSKREGIQSSLPPAIFLTITHHHTLRKTAQKALSAHFLHKKANIPHRRFILFAYLCTCYCACGGTGRRARLRI